MTRTIEDTEKAQLIFGALNQVPRPRLTLTDLALMTAMSPAQVRKGWSMLRKTLGEQIAVMEPHREHSVYFLSEEFNDGARYMFWQARHLYARIASARYTVRDLIRAGEHMPEAVRQLRQSEGNLSGAFSNIQQLLEAMGRRAEIPEEELERILSTQD